MKLPIKRLVLDECQRLNKRDGARHIALKALFYEAVIMLSGTFIHNKWQDISGLVDFVSGHPSYWSLDLSSSLFPLSYSHHRHCHHRHSSYRHSTIVILIVVSITIIVDTCVRCSVLIPALND